MNHLYQVLLTAAKSWRESDYPSDAYPAIGEIFDFQRDAETGNPRYLRTPQLHALEVYWYLRLVKNTPRLFDLYRDLYPKKKDLREALGISNTVFEAAEYDLDRFREMLVNDNDFVRSFKLEALRESLNLSYPSYIFALAMGAGKTILIGSIIATEFAMAMEYGDNLFSHNALVFAPGKTIVEALRELSAIPYGRILPPRMFKAFAASIKITFTRDGDSDIPVIRGSHYNLIVTNTEKIRITASSIRKGDLGRLFAGGGAEEDAKLEVANRRLQTVASLPNLAIFSDEAHHLYGQPLEARLKRVRETVDYLASNTRVTCIVNTTGTPYFNRQPLKDVVIWYGLSEGIRDGYLKEVAGNIQAYDFSGNVENYLSHVIRDFFKDYASTRLPNGAPARLAMYFPQNDDLIQLKPVVEQTLAEIGQSPDLCLVNTSDERLTKQADIDAFNRLNDPNAPHRILLLVNKGTEGWNCPSLYACALVRRLTSSNNFVLQAASRCLRQVPGNAQKARIYLSQDNFGILDRQLQETYGETIADLNREITEQRRTMIQIAKLNIPPLVITQILRTVVPRQIEQMPLSLTQPKLKAGESLTLRTFDLAEQQSTRQVLRQTGDAKRLDIPIFDFDQYSVAVELSSRYRLDLWETRARLKDIYQIDDIPASHLDDLARQIEGQVCTYEVKEERVDRALALIRPEGFQHQMNVQGVEVYTAEITYPKDREHLLCHIGKFTGNNAGFGFHYTPYNFDSNPEEHFFERMLRSLNQHPEEVEDIYFTGAITDPSKTDFFVEYKDDKGKHRRYTPDFIIRRRDGKTLIVEIKREHDREHPIDGENGRKAMAIRKWEDLNPHALRYEIIFTSTDTIPEDQLSHVNNRIFTNENA